MKTEEEIKKAYKLYEEGFTLQQIGDLYGITREWVRLLFKRYNLSSRSKGANRLHFFCDKNHPLGKGEAITHCNTCIKERKEFRAKGLHRATHCKHGHELKDNYYTRQIGNHEHRICKTCRSGYMKRYYEKKKPKDRTPEQERRSAIMRETWAKRKAGFYKT